MNGVVEIGLGRFFLMYLLLIVVLVIMRLAKVQQSKLLIVASVQMTVQLVLAGYLLTYIFANPNPLFTLLYVGLMAGFAIYRVLSKNPELNRRFKVYVAISLLASGLGVVIFFIGAVISESLFNPQYAIPLSGMIFGNVMTGLNLGIKTFRENLDSQRSRLTVLLNFGGRPNDILRPFVSQALETALLPTLNSMVGMGVVSLPGMMTGQILSGTLPTTAILYQICIMIAVCTVVCLSVFGALYFGAKTLVNSDAYLSF